MRVAALWLGIGLLAVGVLVAPLVAMADDGRGFPRGGGGVPPNLRISSLTVGAGDVTLSATTDINLGNAAGSQIRGGSGVLRLDDVVGSQISYSSTAALCDGTNVTLTASSGTVIATGDTTSPVKAAFRVTPQDAQPSGAAVVGDMYVTTAGVLRICVTAGTPCGLWVNVGSQ